MRGATFCCGCVVTSEATIMVSVDALCSVPTGLSCLAYFFGYCSRISLLEMAHSHHKLLISVMMARNAFFMLVHVGSHSTLLVPTMDNTMAPSSLYQQSASSGGWRYEEGTRGHPRVIAWQWHQEFFSRSCLSALMMLIQYSIYSLFKTLVDDPITITTKLSRSINYCVHLLSDSTPVLSHGTHGGYEIVEPARPIYLSCIYTR